MPKASTIKKPKTTNNNKKSNKFDLKKNWKKTAYIGMAGFLFFLSIGYGGVSYYQQKDAKAAGWYTIGTFSGMSISQNAGLVAINRSGTIANISTQYRVCAYGLRSTLWNNGVSSFRFSGAFGSGSGTRNNTKQTYCTAPAWVTNGTAGFAYLQAVSGGLSADSFVIQQYSSSYY